MFHFHTLDLQVYPSFAYVASPQSTRDLRQSFLSGAVTSSLLGVLKCSGAPAKSMATVQPHSVNVR